MSNLTAQQQYEQRNKKVGTYFHNLIICKRCGLEQVKGSREATRDFVYSDICIGCMKKENK